VEYCTRLHEKHLPVIDGGGNMLLALLSKTDHIGSRVIKPGECAGQGR
jgi:hypothetical protein